VATSQVKRGCEPKEQQVRKIVADSRKRLATAVAELAIVTLCPQRGLHIRRLVELGLKAKSRAD